jgi:CubicO group peptidase (beta-lactamase class C family)
MKSLLLIALALVAAPVGARTWTEIATGRKIEAEFLRSDGSTVTIALPDGGTFQVELARLSPEDRAFVEARTALAAPGKKPVTRVEADRFEDIRLRSADAIPVSGQGHNALAAVDAVILGFMVEKGLGAVTCAVSHRGELLHDRAYGWADAELKTPLQPGVRMRLASMTKPVVKAAIATLVRENQLTTDALVFELLELGRHPEAKGRDERWGRVTIQHLLDHKGGWDRDLSGDFTFATGAICAHFKIKPEQITTGHVTRFGLTQKFDFDPGERDAYCNYGYILLARVIEKVSGRSFIDYVQATVAKTAQAPSFSISASDARDRQPGEIWYCYHPEHDKKSVPLPFRTEARDGAGVLAATASDYCRFLEAYWISGEPRQDDGRRYSYSFNGSHAGVTAVCAQRPDGLNYAVICNRRAKGPPSWNTELRARIDAALEPVAAELAEGAR